MRNEQDDGVIHNTSEGSVTIAPNTIDSTSLIIFYGLGSSAPHIPPAVDGPALAAFTNIFTHSCYD